MTRTMDPFDELASMFLTQPDEGGAGHAPQSVIELLVVGHLPVRAGLWLTPYADAVARNLGPTVLLRLDRDEPILQVLRGDDSTHPSATDGSLKQTIAELAGSAAAWIVYSGEATPSELVIGKPDRVTVLSSADDAAVVAAYQHAKNLASAAEAQQTTMPAVGLSVLGADEEAARRVFDRVNRTTTAFLGVEIELIGVLPKMDAAVRSTSYVNFPGERAPAIADVIEWIAEARKTKSAKPQAASAAAPPVAEAPAHDGDMSDGPRVSEQERELLHEASTADRTEMPGKQPEPEPSRAAQQPEEAPVEEKAEPHEPPLVEYVAYEPPRRAQQQQRQQEQQHQHARQHQRRPARVVPRPQMELEPKQPEAPREPDRDGQPVPLASYIDELTPITPRCPNHERIELAVGRTGRVHLLGRADDLRDVHYVQSWVKLHSELLSMACPNVTIDPAARPVCHVFTDQPVNVSDLHGCDLKLHVLAPVDANGQRAWYAAPLN